VLIEFAISVVCLIFIALAIGSQIQNRLIKDRTFEVDEVGKQFESFWVGFSILIAALPLINVFVPLANPILFSGLSIVSLGILLTREFRAVSNFEKLETPPSVRGQATLGVSAGICITLLFLFFTRVSNTPILNYDSYLYHLARIEYFASERFVVGIGNIHSRFAFPSNHFAISAFIEGGPLGTNGFRYFNSFVAFITIVQIMGLIGRMLVRNSNGHVSEWFFLFGAGIVIIKFLSEPSIYISSPSPDFVASLMVVISFVYILKYFECRNDMAFVNALIVSLGSTIYRPIGFAVVVLLVLHYLLFRSGGAPNGSGFFQRLMPLPRIAVSFLLFMCLSLLLSSVLSSGSLLYPAPLRSLSFGFLPWSIDFSQSVSDLDWIRSWARAPGLNPDDVLGSWEWLAPWWRSGVGSAIVAQLRIALLVIVVVNLTFSRSGQNRPTSEKEPIYEPFWLGLFGICPALAWFFTSPALRFGWGALVVLIWTPFAVLLFSSGLSGSDVPKEKFNRGSGALFALSVVLVLFPLAQNVVSGLGIRTSSPMIEEISVTPPVIFERSIVETVNDVSLIAPVSGDQCGRIKWCTPYNTSGINIRTWSFWTVVSHD